MAVEPKDKLVKLQVLKNQVVSKIKSGTEDDAAWHLCLYIDSDGDLCQEDD